MDKLFHDPKNFKADTFEKFVVKLHKLNELATSHNDWGPNLYHATKDLPDDEELKDRIIRYLANPSGVENVVSNSQASEFKVLEGHVPPDFTMFQNMKITNQSGDYCDVEVTNECIVEEPDDEKSEQWLKTNILLKHIHKI